MEPYHDILGVEQTESSEGITLAYERLYKLYEREDKLETPEYTDIETAYNTIKTGLQESDEPYYIDRAVWVWVTRRDKEGQWNTLVRKAHIQAERTSNDWNTEEGKANKRHKEEERRKAKHNR